MRTSEDWEWLAASSEYLAAIAVQELLKDQKLMEAGQGLAVLIESMGKSKKLALKSQLTQLMMQIIKWKCQSEKRTSSWETTIISARDEIADIQEEVPSLNRNYLESTWETSFKKAIRQAESQMSKRCQLTALSWQEVFEDEYSLFDYN